MATATDGGVYERIASREPGFVFHGRDIIAALQMADMTAWAIAYHIDRTAEARYRTVPNEFDDEVAKRIRLAMQTASRAANDLREIAENLGLDVGILGRSAIARRIKKYPLIRKESR